MFANRIRQYYMDETNEIDEVRSDEPERSASGFALLPTFAGRCASVSGPPDIYRVAYEQARQQVAARHERQRRAHEWN